MDDGSIEPLVIQLNALAEQPGVLATLSRWRSWVQIPSRALDDKARFSPSLLRNRTIVPWSSGNDTSLTKRERGFDSLRDDYPKAVAQRCPD
jgi:hypothetical protein